MAPITHRRFDDAESDTPIPALPENHLAPEDDKSEDNSGSDSDSDAAPEALTTSAALSATRNASAKIASTLQAQTNSTRRKRQQREAERAATSLKSKSKKSSKPTSTSKSKDTVVPLSETMEGANGDLDLDASDISEAGDEVDSDSDDSTDPPLLPLSVLAAAEKSAQQQAQAEILRSAPVVAARKRRFVDVGEPAPVRDVKVGRTAVRVLAKGPEGLPPRASKKSRGVKEGWLAGRRGQAGQRRR